MKCLFSIAIALIAGVVMAQSGDVDGDGWILWGDVNAVHEHLLDTSELASAELDRADCNSQDGVDIADAVWIQNHLTQVDDIWHGLGDSAPPLRTGLSNTPFASMDPAMAIDADGHPVVAWVDEANAGRDVEIWIRRWNSTEWVGLGDESDRRGGISQSQDFSEEPRIAADSNGNIVVSWREDGRRLFLKQWNGSTWEELGGSASGLGVTEDDIYIGDHHLAMNGSGEIAVAWKDNGIQVRKWDGGSWAPLGDGSTFSNISNWDDTFTMSLDPSGNPIVTWRGDDGITDQIYASRWSGSEWLEIGAGSASGEGISASSDPSMNPVMALDSVGNPVIAWQEWRSPSMDIHIRRWNGINWEEVGAGSASGEGITDDWSESAQNLRMAIDSAENPTVGWIGTASGLGYKTIVRQWDGSGWQTLSTNSIPSMDIYTTDPWELTINGSDNPVLFWTENPGVDVSSSQIIALEWDGAEWSPIGDGSRWFGGVSNSRGESSDQDLALDSSDRPVLAWVDRTSGSPEIFVRRWEGVEWLEVGSGSATGEGISQTSFAADPSIAASGESNIVVAWTDASSGTSEIYVRHWDGVSWEEYGTGAASGGGISNSSAESITPVVALDSMGWPVVTWANADTESSPKQYAICVQRWNGSAWEEVRAGSASGEGIARSEEITPDPDLILDYADRPIVTWISGQQIYTRRWDGNDWVEIGAESASGGGITNYPPPDPGEQPELSRSPSISLDLDGNPVVAWQHYKSGGPPIPFGTSPSGTDIRMRRWDGDSWEPVGDGPNGAVPDLRRAVRTADIEIDHLGRICIAYEARFMAGIYKGSIDWSEVIAMRWSGNVWEEIGVNPDSIGNVSNTVYNSSGPSLALSPSGDWYLAWSHGNDEILLKTTAPHDR